MISYTYLLRRTRVRISMVKADNIFDVGKALKNTEVMIKHIPMSRTENAA